MVPEPVVASFESCRAITRHHAKSFYFASRGLRREARAASYAVYAYCRYVDDAVDEASGEEEIASVVVRLREQLQRREFPQPWGLAFAVTVERHGIPWLYFEELLEGIALDQGRVRLRDWQELDRYCYLVAGVVGLMMTHIFTKPTPELLERAKDLGTAMQLTNILRDVQEDFERDRIYLPTQELAAYGLTEEFIAQGTVTPAWREFMRAQVQRARDYYERSERGIRALPRDGVQLTVWMMREIYAGILAEIERADYDVFKGRVRTSRLTKCRLAARAWLKERGGH